jgi:hypothetical protein
MIGPRLAVCGGCCALVLSGCGGGSHTKEVVLAQRAAKGRHASALASVTSGPGAAAVRVTSAPRQRVSGSWAVSCRQSTATSRDAEDFAGRVPLEVQVRPFGSPGDTCILVATAKLAQSGHVKVELLGR